MKKWKMRFTPEASRLLSGHHPENKKMIKQALIELRQNPFIAKNLQEELIGFRSLRLKKFRIIYQINEEEDFLEIYYIGRRRDVYEQFRSLLIELQNSSSTDK